jgi:hypothetical protein
MNYKYSGKFKDFMRKLSLYCKCVDHAKLEDKMTALANIENKRKLTRFVEGEYLASLH